MIEQNGTSCKKILKVLPSQTKVSSKFSLLITKVAVDIEITGEVWSVIFKKEDCNMLWQTKKSERNCLRILQQFNDVALACRHYINLTMRSLLLISNTWSPIYNIPWRR